MRRTRKLTPDGERIKIKLWTYNMTARDLALRIGKTDGTICDVISGKNRSQATLRQILEVLEEEERRLAMERRRLRQAEQGRREDEEDEHVESS